MRARFTSIGVAGVIAVSSLVAVPQTSAAGARSVDPCIAAVKQLFTAKGRFEKLRDKGVTGPKMKKARARLKVAQDRVANTCGDDGGDLPGGG